MVQLASYRCPATFPYENPCPSITRLVKTGRLVSTPNQMSAANGPAALMKDAAPFSPLEALSFYQKHCQYQKANQAPARTGPAALVTEGPPGFLLPPLTAL